MPLFFLTAAIVAGLVLGFPWWTVLAAGLAAGYLAGQVVSYHRTMRAFDEFFADVLSINPALLVEEEDPS